LLVAKARAAANAAAKHGAAAWTANVPEQATGSSSKVAQL
jgi:hypothetical protein